LVDGLNERYIYERLVLLLVVNYRGKDVNQGAKESQLIATCGAKLGR
jgi:hypothetical protein